LSRERDRGACPNSFDAGHIIEHFCCREDLATYDPYDTWETPLGFCAKDLFNRNRRAGLFATAIGTLFDTFINNRLRLLYSRQQYANCGE